MPDEIPNTGDVQTPPAPGGVGDSQPGSTPDAPAGDIVQIPQDELNKKFGERASQAQKALATEQGFESVEQMNSALAAYKQWQDGQKTEAERITEENKALKKRERDAIKKAQALELESEVQRQALALGADPTLLKDVIRLRDSIEGEINADGTLNKDIIAASVNKTFEGRDYLLSSPEPQTHRRIGQGSNPHRTPEKTPDQESREAAASGNAIDAIGAQLKKMFS